MENHHAINGKNSLFQWQFSIANYVSLPGRVSPFWDDEIPIFQAIHASKQPGELGLHRLTHRMRQIRLDLLRDHQGIP